MIGLSGDCFVNASDKTLLEDGVGKVLEPVHMKLDRIYAMDLTRNGADRLGKRVSLVVTGNLND